MSTTDRLSQDIGDALSTKDAFRYRSIVGGLQYLTLTRSNLSVVVNRVCKFLSHPTTIRYEAVKRILRYIKGTVFTGILITSAPSVYS
jgi:histone deacetylase 1/2